MSRQLQHFLEKTPLSSQWKLIGIEPRHGIDIPLSALRSSDSCGIGEFLDLLPLISWCKEVGFSIIQLLPLNDSGNDPSPYNAQSSIAINYIYLSLRKLPFLESDKELIEKLDGISRWNETKQIAYYEVMQAKTNWLKDYFRKHKENLLTDPGYHHFIEENSWVKDYALYKSIKSALSHSSWQDWPESLQNPTKETWQKLLDTHSEMIIFFSMLQYLCHIQLQTVKSYATSMDVLIKGDIPILISPDSVDVWLQRHLFDMDYVVGMKPDIYSTKGQLWGFPLLMWDAIAEDNYNWWKNRLFFSSNYYHLYRIDHAAGFYRLWAIPKGLMPKDGSYIPHDVNVAIASGHEILHQIIILSSMLPIAEDLGDIPKALQDSLQKLGIPGTRIMRWERNWDTDESYILPKHYNPLTMTSISTHDSPTLAQWWRDYPEEAAIYCEGKKWTYSPLLSQKERLSILQEAHSTASIFHINLFQEYLALFPELVHARLDEERINIPGLVLVSNWTYRYKEPLEKILSHEPLKKAIRSILKR